MHEIRLMPLDELIPNPMNPKAHDQGLLQKSLESFGYVEPIVIDGRTNQMISGHGRKEILEKMYLDNESPPEGVTIEDGRWMVPVVTGWSSKDDSEAKAVLVALNRTTEKGGWDNENLLSILQDLKESELLDMTGYLQTDIAVLEKLLEADSAFHVDLSSAIDEFIEGSGADPDRIALQFSTSLKVYFQTEEARKEFFDSIDYQDTNQVMLRYPKSFEKKAAEQWTG